MKEITNNDFLEASDALDNHFEELERNLLRLIKCTDVWSDDDVLDIVVDLKKSITMINSERLNLEYLGRQMSAAYDFMKDTGRDYWTNAAVLSKK